MSLVFCRLNFSHPFNKAGGNLDSVEIYDSASQRWSLAKLSQGRWHIAAASVRNLAIFAGGMAAAGVSLLIVRCFIDHLHHTKIAFVQTQKKIRSQ
jgi:hypothetical protein